MNQISVKKRDVTIKAKRLGMVPGNIIGKSLPESVSIQMEEAEARRLVRQLREGSKVSLDLEGQGSRVTLFLDGNVQETVRYFGRDLW